MKDNARAFGNLQGAPLGRKEGYVDQYAPELLYPVPRSYGRESMGCPETLPFTGEDIWNGYELSWLEPSGRPVVALFELRVPAESPNLIESKSLKLYLNSLNMTVFSSREEVEKTVTDDLSKAAGVRVDVAVRPAGFLPVVCGFPPGICIDYAPFHRRCEAPDPALLQTGEQLVAELLWCSLFRSRCPVTGQPDWATVAVEYAGKQIDQSALLEYLVSYRTHQGFHEACVEQIFLDIQQQCDPDGLLVTARFTRRGGLDINPMRATSWKDWENIRTPFQ